MIQDEINEQFPNRYCKTKKVIGLIKYITSYACISGFQLMKEEKLTLFLLLNYEKWRSHDDKVYKYNEGSWEVKNFLTNDQ